MNRADVSAALGEMYEPIYPPPANACPDPADGEGYGHPAAGVAAARRIA